MDYDVIIIGAGVIGTSIARFLSQYLVKCAVLEKHSDVGEETSKANSGIIHAGHDPLPNTKKAKFNVRGNALMHHLAPILGIDFVENGAMVLCLEESELPLLETLYKRGLENGVPDLSILSKKEILEREPNVNPEVVAALWCPTSAIVCPFSLTLAMAENASANGVSFYLSTEVVDIKKREDGFEIFTSKGSFSTRTIVNASGLWGGHISSMVSSKEINITPRRGEYVLLDKSEGEFIKVLFSASYKEEWKGVLVTPTVHGNILVGPNAKDIENMKGTNTTEDGMAFVQERALQSVPSINYKKIITSFAGLRAHPKDEDFIIEEAEDAKGFFNVIGIESPGLSCAASIGEYVSNLVAKSLKAEINPNFNPYRKAKPKLAHMSLEERNDLIKENPLYGNIICRCEEISEGEIVDAVKGPLGARSLDGVKRRARAGMGRCQGGFCSPKVMEIIARETGLEMEDICKNDEGSEVLKK